MQQPQSTWDYLDSVYETSIAYQFATYADEIEFEDLPEPVVHRAKQSLLDTLGCAIGGYRAPGTPACMALVDELGGAEEATVFGTGVRTSAANAALVNSFLARYLDYNDVGGGCHGSDAIPGLLAVCEREGASGKELITAIVISYELGSRFRDAVAAASGKGYLAANGWTPDVRAGVNVPPALGKLMGLDRLEMANAIGCTASRNLPLKILDAHREELTMTKNIRFGSIVRDAITSCILAKNGFTGPINVVEGEFGLGEVLLDGNYDPDTLLDFDGWRMLDTTYKTICANATSHGHILATLGLVEEHDLEPEDIESVVVKAGARELRHTTTLSRKWPRNGETGDHSLYYANAVAILNRSFGPESFEDELYTDPDVVDLIGKISYEPDPELEEWSLEGISEITTTDGSTYRKHVRETPGLIAELSDEELEAKFESMATERMDDGRVRELVDAVWAVDSLDSVGDLTDMMAFDSA